MSDPVPPDWVEAANLHATVAQLLSTVIHQVNNALQTIGGHAELLKTDVGATDTTRRRANTITTVNERTAAMLASFQVFTRPPLGAEVYNLRDVAEQALAFRRYGLGRARIEATIAEGTLVAADGAVIVKLWFHLSKKAQRRRLKDLESDPKTHWRVLPSDWKHFKLYDKFTEVSERAIRRTDSGHAPWHLIEAADRRAVDGGEEAGGGARRARQRGEAGPGAQTSQHGPAIDHRRSSRRSRPDHRARPGRRARGAKRPRHSTLATIRASSASDPASILVITEAR